MAEKRKIKIKLIQGTVENHALDTDILMQNAKKIIASELEQYRKKTEGGVSLGLKEARVVQGYLDSLTKLQKEEREQSRAQDLSNLTDEEMMLLAQQVFGGLPAKKLKNTEQDPD